MNHTGSYGPNRSYSSFDRLPQRAGLPLPVHTHLSFHGVTGMAKFVTTEALNLINEGYEGGLYQSKARLQAISVWNAARTARKDLIKAKDPTLPDEDDEWYETWVKKPRYNERRDEMEQDDVKMVNADRNEMVALLQGAKGAQFVKVHMQHSRLDEHDSQQRRTAPRLTYKAVDLDLAEGDYVVVQYRDRLGIGVVEKILEDAPTSDEYDYRTQLKHVVQKIDVTRAKQLAELDRQILKKITASEAQDRMERLTRQLGIAMDAVTLELPKLEE